MQHEVFPQEIERKKKDSVLLAFHSFLYSYLKKKKMRAMYFSFKTDQYGYLTHR